MIRHYATPLTFKQALEQRIKSSSATGADFARRRQLLVIDRFLARVVSVGGDAAMLKGGLVLEMRLARARTTKDIDLCLMGSSDNVLDRLQAAGRLDLGDYMFFEVQPDLDHPKIQNEAMVRRAQSRSSRRFGPNPRPDFSDDFHPASREIKQERRST
jgi:nucleotidyltransferase AbiEii toxin of type IV toxin-antitoxin system